MNKEEIKDWFKGLQDKICKEISEADGGALFESELWSHEKGGGGDTRLLQNGNVLEKAGVNFSAVHGPTPEKILNALKLEQADFFATGVSIVMHPKNPMTPIIHMNVRYFEMSNGVNWFGGGIDLTPIYVDKEEAKAFHQDLKDTCDKHHPDYYKDFKAWADDYFFIKHRDETRGIGGIFFDRLSTDKYGSIEEKWPFVQDIGSLFPKIYSRIIKTKGNLPFGEKEVDWQLLRRSRYVEFNLVLDKGTKFGLDTNGRTESILMSMPPLARWEYCHTPEKGSKEEETLSLLKKGVNWV